MLWEGVDALRHARTECVVSIEQVKPPSARSLLDLGVAFVWVRLSNTTQRRYRDSLASKRRANRESTAVKRRTVFADSPQPVDRRCAAAQMRSADPGGSVMSRLFLSAHEAADQPYLR